MMANNADFAQFDAETRVAEWAEGDKTQLRLWLRLLTCTTMIEAEVRRRLRDTFDVTLPRFDLMAQLNRSVSGMTLGELSQRMMVSNGNITGLVDRLVQQQLVERWSSPTDRRVQLVALTSKGRTAFRVMARAHEGWVAELFADLSRTDIDMLMKLLAKTKASAVQSSSRTN